MLAVLGLVTASLSSRGGQPSFLSAAAIAQSSSSALLADTAEPSQPVSVSGLVYAHVISQVDLSLRALAYMTTI